MSRWINSPIILSGDRVRLVPLEKSHLPALATVAQDKKIWAYYAYDGSDPEKFSSLYHTALADMPLGNQYTFVIIQNQGNKVIGSTKFMDIQPLHRKLEIGTTWLAADCWGSGINLECKYLLLNHCFEVLHTVRVQLKTDENNLRSRKAIKKIGGHFEGILRNDMIRDNQTLRNSAYYSIIQEEWPVVKKMLEQMLAAVR